MIFVFIALISFTTFGAENQKRSLRSLLDKSFKLEIDKLKASNRFYSTEEQKNAFKLYEVLKSDFSYLSRIRFSKTTKLFKEIFGSNLVGHILKHVHEVDWDNTLSGQRAPIASASGVLQSPYISFGENYLGDHFSRIERVGIIIHEAQHNVSDDFAHVLCPYNFEGRSTSGLPLAQLPACEENYNGSYGAQVIFLKNIAKYCITCTSEEMKVADEIAKNYQQRIIGRDARAMIYYDN
jgi:hypothetical protein